jgi:hypothetical protein
MSRPSLRTFAVLVLSLSLGTPLCAAARPGFEAGRAKPEHPAPADLVYQLWGWFTGVWSAVGCSIDPGGLCLVSTGGISTSAEVQEDVGCSIDPGGIYCNQ